MSFSHNECWPKCEKSIGCSQSGNEGKCGCIIYKTWVLCSQKCLDDCKQYYREQKKAS